MTRPSNLIGTSALAAALAVTALYLLIGLEVVRVDGLADREPGPAVPLIVAGLVFAALAVLLAWRPSRLVALAGAVPTVLVLVAYVGVAPSRDPSYEPWGLSIKALQLLLLVALVALAVRPSSHRAGTPERDLTTSTRP